MYYVLSYSYYNTHKNNCTRLVYIVAVATEKIVYIYQTFRPKWSTGLYIVRGKFSWSKAPSALYIVLMYGTIMVQCDNATHHAQ